MTSPVRVLVDATELSGPSEFRGIGTYLRNLLASLANDGRVELWALTTDPSTLPSAGVHPVVVRRRAPARFVGRERDWRLPREIAEARRRHGVAVFLAPATHLPRTSAVPVVATLHDVVPLVTPGYELERPRWEVLAGRYREAAAVIAVSGYSAQEGTRVLGLDPARVTVAHLGVSEVYCAGPSDESGDYLLLVGEFDPRKRHALAVQLLDAVRARSLDIDLRVVGTIPPVYEAEWAQVLQDAQSAEHVSVLGRVSVDRLVSLYRGAAALLVMSSIEGFGLPALEAMACGTPVVAFRNSATEEVIGRGAELVPEGDLACLEQRVVDLVSDSALRERASSAALERASSFTWAACADQHVSAFLRVAS